MSATNLRWFFRLAWKDPSRGWSVIPSSSPEAGQHTTSGITATEPFCYFKIRKVTMNDNWSDYTADKMFNVAKSQERDQYRQMFGKDTEDRFKDGYNNNIVANHYGADVFFYIDPQGVRVRTR